MKKFLVVLLVPWLLNSKAQEQPLGGMRFVFSFQPQHFVILNIAPQREGETRLLLLCARNCQDRYSVQRGKTVLPVPISWQLEKSKRVLSGKLLPVLVLTASATVLVTMVEVADLQSMDATMLFPEHVRGTEYYLITQFDYGVVIVTSYNNSVTHVNVTLKDNLIYFRNNLPKFKDIPNRVWQRTLDVPVPKIDFEVSTPASEILIPYEPVSITLGPLESYYILSSPGSDITGMHIRSDKPIAATQGADTTWPLGAKNSDLAVDSIPPVETLGRFFLVPYSTLNPEESNIKVLSAVNNNRLNIQVVTRLYSFVFAHRSDWLEFILDFRQNAFVSSSGSLLVVRTITHTENFSFIGPCMMSVVPAAQWSRSFSWTSVENIQYEHTKKTLQHFAIISVLSGYTRNIVIDGSAIPDEDWVAVDALVGSPSQRRTYKFVAIRLVRKARHEASVLDELDVGFYVTLFSYAAEFSYCTSAGQAVKTINPPLEQCKPEPTKPGDEYDNDCDGNYDEEVDDGEDNDRDNLIDEDLEADNSVDGGWGQWMPFLCVAPCGWSEGVFTRARRCDSPPVRGAGAPCDGAVSESNDTVCRADHVKCASECAAKEWGYNCSRKCDSCDPDCDKVTGECQRCMPGFTSRFCNETCPFKCMTCQLNGSCLTCSSGLLGPPGCNQPCPAKFYGQNCEDACAKTCWNAECESKTGACLRCPAGMHGFNCTIARRESKELHRILTKKSREKFWYFGLIPVAVIPILTAVVSRELLRMKRKRKQQVERLKGVPGFGSRDTRASSQGLGRIEVIEVP